jgi:hypothetical protein
MRLVEIASTLAPLEHTAPDALHSIIRGPVIKSLLSGRPGRGRTSAADYKPEELARVRILLAARDCGLSGFDMTELNRVLNEPPAAGMTHPASAFNVGGGANYPTGLRSIIRGTRAGETWNVRVRFTVTNEGQRRVSPWVRWEGWGEDLEAIKAADLLNGETPRGILEIPASELIAPLLDLIREGE